MAGQVLLLRALLEQRHWRNHRTFCLEYEKAAVSIDPRLRGTAPSRAQLHRWISGELRVLPYGDHCRVLERMFPGWSAQQLFALAPENWSDLTASQHSSTEQWARRPPRGAVDLVTSGSELSAAMREVVRGARSSLVAVGSRSSEPAYLHEIEQAMQVRSGLVHHRILIGPPHSQALKDHLVHLIKISENSTGRPIAQRLHISLREDLTRYYERFFVASDAAAVAILPSGTSPMNFDTGVIVRDASYVTGLLQHGKALHSKNRLETRDDISRLEVLG